MTASQALDALVHATLRIDPALVTDDLSYQDISQWDSLGHVRLMQAVETTYAIKLTSERITQLTSVRALRDFADKAGAREGPAPVAQPRRSAGGNAPAAVSRGLVGICFDRSEITDIDASGGMLRYRGYGVDELIERASYEEVAFLLIHGTAPTADELARFRGTLRRARTLPAALAPLLASMAAARPFLVLQAAIAVLGAQRAQQPDADADADIALIAQLPCVLGLFHRLRTGAAEPPPRADLGHAEHLLYGLHGRLPQPVQARALDRALSLLADHSASASTFTARVVTGARADPHAAICSAIGAFSGPLHGGAVDQVMAMVDEIGSPAAAADYVRARLDRNEPIYGFGHRIYRGADPRSGLLRGIARTLGGQGRGARTLDVLDAVADAMSGYSRLGLDTNVDFYASALFEALDIPRDLFGPLFASARVAGLVAHVREQQRNNVLIRPQLLYAGPGPRSYGAGARA
ncbi:citrate/2-methylcitrate synthase [Ramlibacter sp.]|uniref:citrate/2-methylcitrate synthase n=1 Tax=Ramlibacter sp. TaxID=1917967 RepID=UPI00183C78E3|nr:citrate/2-methylcitrate synthase [Ramlibacter sp.]MBA2672263.1 citrate (Si)-synthase [Ramlibacter sp.]